MPLYLCPSRVMPAPVDARRSSRVASPNRPDQVDSTIASGHRARPCFCYRTWTADGFSHARRALNKHFKVLPRGDIDERHNGDYAAAPQCRVRLRIRCWASSGSAIGKCTAEKAMGFVKRA